MPLTLHRVGLHPVVAAISLLPLAMVYTGCRNLTPEGASGPPAAYGVPEHHFQYCELKPVQQEVDTSGGLASLAAVMRYWDTETGEAELAQKYPLPESGAHSIRKLRRIAIDEGLTGFALVMKDNGINLIGEQLENGRPVIVALELPAGGYASAGATAVSGAELGGARTAVVFGQSEDEFLVLDAAAGVVRMPKAEFDSAWAAGKYAALICSAS